MDTGSGLPKASGSRARIKASVWGLLHPHLRFVAGAGSQGVSQLQLKVRVAQSSSICPGTPSMVAPWRPSRCLILAPLWTPTPAPPAPSLLSLLLELRRPARLSSLHLHPTFRPETSGLLACSCARGPSWACTWQALSAHCSAKDPRVPGAPGSQALGVTVPAPDPTGGPATGGNHVHEEPLTFRCFFVRLRVHGLEFHLNTRDSLSWQPRAEAKPHFRRPHLP